MYIAVVALTMVLLPAVSVLVEHAAHPDSAWMFLVGRWFVFWGVGVRLGIAGLRQFLQPEFTARQIFGMTSDDALPIIRELGAANAATALVGLLSLFMPSFLLPVAISAGLFYGIAGLRHLAAKQRSVNENVAMASDLFLAAILAGFVASRVVIT